MPSFFMALDVEHLDRNTELLQRARAARELLRIENVGGLVDQIARQQARRRKSPNVAHRPCARPRHRRLQPSRCVSPAVSRRPCVWFYSGRMRKRADARLAQDPRPARTSWRRPAVRRTLWHRWREFGSLPMAEPPSLRKSFGLSSLVLPSPITTSRAALSPAGTTSSSAEFFLPVKRSAFAAARHQVGRRPEGLRRSRAEFEPVVAEHHENALGGGGEGAKAKLEGVGHR